MATPSIYDQYALFIDGALATQTQNLKLMMDGKDTDVETIPLGWAGITPAPKTLQLDVTEAVPTTGFEFDPMKSFLNSELHHYKIQGLGSGKSVEFDGFVLPSPELDSGVGKSSTLTFKVKGNPDTLK